MSGSITLRNYKKLSETFMRPSSTKTIGNVSIAGDKILLAGIDGSAVVVDDYSNRESSSSVNRFQATLFPTDRHVVVYGTRGGLKSDLAFALPVNMLKGISFRVSRSGKRKNGLTCSISFMSKKETGWPSIGFFANVDSVYTYDAICKVLGVCADTYRIPLENGTDRKLLIELGF